MAKRYPKIFSEKDIWKYGELRGKGLSKEKAIGKLLEGKKKK